MRAILLASATATSIRGLRASIRASQGSFVSPRRTAELTTAMAPMIKRRLRSRWPIFDILPSLGFAAGRVLSRHEAPPSREVAAAPKALHRRREGLERHRANRPDPWDGHEPYRLLVLTRTGAELLLQSADLRIEVSDLTEQNPTKRADRSR